MSLPSRPAGRLLATLLLLAAPAGAQSVAEGHAACRLAGQEAEAAHGVPPGLLLAIGRVESGRRDPSTGQVSAWPWTLNAAGTGQVFTTAEAAQAATRSWQVGGTASIDIGCFQINLMHHPTAFASIEQGFDPRANAAYAGRFLSSLRVRTGSWEAAVAAYHSATPERGAAYRDRVLSHWAGAGATPAPVVAPALPLPERVLAWRPLPATGGIRIWTPSRPGSAPSVITVSMR